MEIHIAQSPSHHPHHRYPQVDEYYTGHPAYNNFNPDVDFQQRQMLLNNQQQHQIKSEEFGSPPPAGRSPLEASPPKMVPARASPSTSSPPAFNTDHQQKLSAFAFLQPGVGETPFGLPYGLGSVSPTSQNVSSVSSKSGGSKHDRKRPYPCAMCSSRFGSKMELEEHQNSHTGMKPFECDVCQSRFNRRSTLWNHKRIHSDAKPFSCTVCQMTFKWKNSLKCHKEMHARKNETSNVMDNDIKLLTYATAAKKKMAEASANGLPPTAAIQTVASRKKSANKKMSKIKKELQDHNVSTTASAVTTSFLFHNLLGDQNSDSTSTHQHLAITHTSAQQQLDLSQFNHNNLLMQAIYSGNSSSIANTNSASQNQNIADEALELAIGSHNPAAGFSLDLLPTAQPTQSFLLDNHQFLNDAASAVMQNTARLPTNFPMNILDFQQQLAGSQQQSQQMPYIQQQPQAQSNLAETLHQQNSSNNSMLNYQRAEILLDDMQVQNLYQQTAFDPSLLLSQSTNNTHQHHQQPQMDQFADYMLNGTPVYQQQTEGTMATGVSLHAQQLQQQQHMALTQQQHQNMAFSAGQGSGMTLSNFPAGFMDDMNQISQEELQNLAKMFPHDSGKW